MYKTLAYLSIIGWVCTIVSIIAFSSPAGATVSLGKANHLPRKVRETNSTVVEENRMFETLEVVEKQSDIEYLIRTKSRKKGFNEEVALRIARCESGLNPEAKNRNSTATGLYQFLVGTWKWTGAEEQGLQRTNPEHSLDMFLEWYPKYPSWWECK